MSKINLTPIQASRIAVSSAIAVSVSYEQLDAASVISELYSRFCDGDRQILDCQTLDVVECAAIADAIDIPATVLAGKYIVLNVN
jgi:hypothetical protein